nr:unnamed protein product [Callosobruchus analis]
MVLPSSAKLFRLQEVIVHCLSATV